MVKHIILMEVKIISFTELRVNQQIRAKEVRVIDAAGASLGIFPVAEALKLADSKGTDLIEMSPNANPPVCKLSDYGKYKYEQMKKDKQAKKKQHVVVVKEIQLRPSIDPHDLGIKLSHAQEFLSKEFKVKFVIRFRGREMEYKEKHGSELTNKVMSFLAPFGELENDIFKEERLIIFVIAPKKQNKV